MLSAGCMHCLLQREMEATEEVQDEAVRAAYIQGVMRLLAEADEGATAPEVLSGVQALYRRTFGVEDRFDALKRRYNALMLEITPTYAERITKARDPLAAALLMARAGNYIDFGAMGAVDPQKLHSLLDTALEQPLPAVELQHLRADLDKAKHLVYLSDNCGEIVLDKLCLQTLRDHYPGLQITVVVRGQPVLNDATMEDALQIGLSPAFQVLPNGTDIAGTSLRRISAHVRQVIEQADVILAKGQGNFETLQGCGHNIYYLFLCKCAWFVKRFGLPLYQGAFLNEQRFEWGA